MEIDGEGNVKLIRNLKKNISVSFANQGLFWYTSKTECLC